MPMLALFFTRNICSRIAVKNSSIFKCVVRNSLKPNVSQISKSAILLGVGTYSILKLKSKNFVHCSTTKLDNNLVLPQQTLLDIPENLCWDDIWTLIKPYLPWLFGAIVGAIAAALVNIKLPLLLGDLVNILAQLKASGSIDTLKPVAIKLALLYFTQSLLTFVYISLLSTFGERIATRLRFKLFYALTQQDIAFFDAHRTGELISRLSSDVQEFKSSFKQCISQGLRSVTQTIGCVITLYCISPQMTLVTVVTLPVVIFTGTLVGSRIYLNEVNKAGKMHERLGYAIAGFQAMANLFLNGVVICILTSGGGLILEGSLTPGQLMSFLVTSQTIQRSLTQMSLLYGQAIKGFTAGARVFQIVHLEPLIPVNGGKIIPYHSLVGEVKFNNVSFSYPTRREHVILENLQLTLPAGKIVALCGPSGQGKSTLACLLERFYDVQNGNITLDGYDIKSLDPTWLRQKVIGIISQEPVLFATTIRENIRYGKPNATNEEVEIVARKAHVDEFIERLPEGFDTIVGERGVMLSGGQKQRIAIARALLKNPTILILDEATSALDANSENIVHDALEEAMKGRTVLVIAHRLSTIRNANIIACVNDRKISEIGSHDELMKKKGHYYKLIQMQNSI